MNLRQSPVFAGLPYSQRAADGPPAYRLTLLRSKHNLYARRMQPQICGNFARLAATPLMLVFGAGAA
jgi:hypothetical protein